MSANYQKLMKLLERWPVDKTKGGRDLGEHLRKQLQTIINPATVTTKVSDKLTQQIDSLERISNNVYAKNYKRSLTSTATGLTAEQCSQVLSSEFLQYLNEEQVKSINALYSTLHPAHIPVLAEKTIEYLNPTEHKIYLDMTFGAGGHTKKLLNSAKNIKIYALDRDPIAYEYAIKLSNDYPGQVIPLLGKFSEIPKLFKDHNIKQNFLDGILFDFGCSSMQFDEANRGFSISHNGPLDMRMDRGRYENQPTAADILAKIEEHDLAKILRIYGEEKAAKKIARAVIEARSAFHKIETTKQLADLVASCFTDPYKTDKLQRPAHSATKTFQALRIFINNELNEINYGMILAQKYLKLNGRLVTITFHSLEDTIVKRHINGNVIEGAANPVPLKYSSHGLSYGKELVDSLVDSPWKQLHKHVIVPEDEEISLNARSRSAKLRAAIRLK